MAETFTKPASYADLEALPSNVVGEILFGHLVAHPRPAPRHGAATNALGTVCTNSYQFGVGGPGGWIFIDEPELHLGPHVAVPDIAGWRRETMSEAPKHAYIETPPDWICEVLSPATEKYDRGDKRKIYATFGVGHLWHLDPRAKLLEVFALQNKDWLLTHTFQDNEDVNAPPFDELTFKLGLLWPFDEPTKNE
jgi:Uma2 family endonuclease